MLRRDYSTAGVVGGPRAASRPSTGLVGYDHGTRRTQVQTPLAAAVELRNPAQMPYLLAGLAQLQPSIDQAMADLHSVHFARFLPTPDLTHLLVITAFDGDLGSYLVDFIAVLGPQFDLILSFAKDGPPLPCRQFPREFVEYVQSIQMHTPGLSMFSAYPEATVLDIQHATRVL